MEWRGQNARLRNQSAMKPQCTCCIAIGSIEFNCFLHSLLISSFVFCPSPTPSSVFPLSTSVAIMADLSDPKIDAAYQDVRSDKSETNWLLLDYESDRSDKLQLAQTGTGGLAELREVLDDTKASYAYVRVTYSNDKESTREKFILVVWIGPNCKVMRKAKISVHAADVKSVLRVFSIEVAAREKDDLNEDPIVVRLRKVCTIRSASYITHLTVRFSANCLDVAINQAGGASYDGV
ncbi:hypothetical protein D9615_005903 [Tricholomella constricta]|uniref:ADF-H domain-containing protein n=1 Tax=Tricholomella constricta TaxID=117010 RepID=A0A8H5H9M0_9AGAR|nr:hypothetical protein D9615_005903 [Tricholomella constricta]